MLGDAIYNPAFLVLLSGSMKCCFSSGQQEVYVYVIYVFMMASTLFRLLCQLNTLDLCNYKHETWCKFALRTWLRILRVSLPLWVVMMERNVWELSSSGLFWVWCDQMRSLEVLHKTMWPSFLSELPLKTLSKLVNKLNFTKKTLRSWLFQSLAARGGFGKYVSSPLWTRWYGYRSGADQSERPRVEVVRRRRVSADVGPSSWGCVRGRSSLHQIKSPVTSLCCAPLTVFFFSCINRLRLICQIKTGQTAYFFYLLCSS